LGNIFPASFPTPLERVRGQNPLQSLQDLLFEAAPSGYIG
jgi:hypothetical protein